MADRADWDYPGAGKQLEDSDLRQVLEGLRGIDTPPISLAQTLTVAGAATLSSTLAVAGAATLSSTLAVTGAVTLSSTLNVAGATTLAALTAAATTLASLAVTGNATVGGTLGVTGATTLAALTAAATTLASLSVTGNANVGGTLGVTGAVGFSSTLGVTGLLSANGGLTTTDLTATGNTALGNANTDTLTVIGVSTFKNAAGTTVQLYVDAGNNRVIVGSATALGSDTTPALHVVGRLYVAPDSANDSAIQVRRSSAATVGWTYGVDAANDLVFKDDADTSIVRIGDVASTYQLDVVAGDFHVADDAVIAGDISASRAVIGSTTFSGTEELRVVGQSRFEGEIANTSGGIVISGPNNIDGNGGTAGQLRIGAVIVNNTSLSGSEELRVTGQSRLEGAVTITTGGIDCTDAVAITLNSGTNIMLFLGSATFTQSSAVTGGATALPANPEGYLRVNIGGGNRCFPYYNQS